MNDNTSGTWPLQELPRSPWVLVDDSTVADVVAVLDRLTGWLTGPERKAVARCACALSLGETTDPDGISSWTDCLAARLRRCADPDEYLEP